MDSPMLLLVEDDPYQALVFSDDLKEHGYQVKVVDDGGQVLAAVNESRPDLVILDIHMPVMDGPTATRVIRSMPDFETIPIYALTADAMVSRRDEHMAAGLDGYLTKPIDFEVMRRLIASLPKRDD